MRTILIGKIENPWVQAIWQNWPPAAPRRRSLVLAAPLAQILLSLPGRLLGWRVIWLLTAGKQNKIMRFRLRLDSFFAHAIIAPNQASEVYYLRLGIGSRKIHLIYPPGELPKSPRRRPEPLTIACDVSGLAIDEGVSLVLRAFGLARDILENCKLILGGSLGENRTDIEWSVRKLGLGQAVQLTLGGKINWLENADMYIIANTNDRPTPLSIVPALCQGKIIIATEKAAHREFVEHESNGLLVPPNDAEALSQAIITLARDEALSAKLSQNAYEFAQKRFSPEIFTQKIINCLQ